MSIDLTGPKSAYKIALRNVFCSNCCKNLFQKILIAAGADTQICHTTIDDNLFSNLTKITIAKKYEFLPSGTKIFAGQKSACGDNAVDLSGCLCRKFCCNECRQEVGFILTSVGEGVGVDFLDQMYFLAGGVELRAERCLDGSF
jgi:hypothetical protein